MTTVLSDRLIKYSFSYYSLWIKDTREERIGCSKTYGFTPETFYLLGKLYSKSKGGVWGLVGSLRTSRCLF